jgi:hypothetical protein
MSSDSNRLSYRKLSWFLWFTFFVISDFVIPYTLLRDIPKFYGAYLFWTVITFVVVASAMVYLRSWSDGGNS